MDKTYPKRIQLHCFNCGDSIFVPPSKQKLVKYCSKACKDASERQYITMQCIQCFQYCHIPMSEINRRSRRFCSFECFQKYRGSTSIEESIRNGLQKYNIPFVQEAKVGKYRLDFLITFGDRNIVIECDGEYWHRSAVAKKRDLNKDVFLIKKDYKVFRFPEKDIRESPFKCLQNIFDFSYVKAL